MDAKLLVLVESNNISERSKAIDEVLECVNKPEIIPSLFELLNIFKISSDFTNFSKTIFILERILSTTKQLAKDHYKYILQQLFSLFLTSPLSISSHVLHCIDTVLVRYQQNFASYIRLVVNSFNKADGEKQTSFLQFLAKFTVPFLTSVFLDENQISKLLDDFVPKVLTLLKEEHTEEFEIAAADLVSSVMKEFSFIPTNFEEMTTILLNNRDVVYHILSNDDILLWPSFPIFQKLEEVLSYDDPIIRMYAIDAIISFLQNEGTVDDVLPIIKNNVFDVCLCEEEVESNEELNFAMNILPNDETPSLRGSICRLINVYKDLDYDKQETKAADGVMQLFGIKLGFKDPESLSFCLLMKAKHAGKLDDDEVDWLIMALHEYKCSTSLIALNEFNKEKAIEEAQKIEDPTPQLSFALDIVLPKEEKEDVVGMSKVWTLLEKWKNKANETDEDSMPDNEIEEDLEKAIDIINGQSRISATEGEEIVRKSIEYFREYRYAYCDNYLAKLIRVSIEKSETFPRSSVDLFDAATIPLEEGELSDSVIETLCLIASNESVRINEIAFSAFTICQMIIKQNFAASSAPFILASIIVQRVPDFIVLHELAFHAFKGELEEELFAGAVVLLASALIVDSDTNVPIDVIDKWIENPDFCSDRKFLKYSGIGLTILAKKIKREGILTAAQTAFETEPGEDIFVPVTLPFDSLSLDEIMEKNE